MTLPKNTPFEVTSPEEQRLYDHLISCVQTESPSQIIERFRLLFVEATGYPDPQVREAVTKIINSKYAEEKFNYILNRCCHIVINRWHMQHQDHNKDHNAIADLLDLFENMSTPKSTYARTARRMHSLVKDFLATEQYLTLIRLAKIFTEDSNLQNNNGHTSHPVGNLINRYPYLYRYCLLSDDCSYEHHETVMSLQAQNQKEFELGLSQFVTYQMRLAQLRKYKGAKRKIIPVQNPTLLTERELASALKQFLGKVQGSYTYKDLARSFIAHTHEIRSYRDFKDDLYEYLISSTNSQYAKSQFSDRLYKHLQNTLSHSDFKKPDESLILRTSSQLLNFLIVESSQRPNHYVFVDLVSNMGATSTVGLLLKITLV
ncbi:MAG: hypothetical protein F6K24_41800 [Okeania sp. SIO2D1]|nr:hypothetical protein [Okeania sp. SIO2D1]